MDDGGGAGGVIWPRDNHQGGTLEPIGTSGWFNLHASSSDGRMAVFLLIEIIPSQDIFLSLH